METATLISRLGAGGRRTRPFRSPFGWSVAYLLALAYQISTNMKIAVADAAGTSRDLVGFALMLGLGSVVVLTGSRWQALSNGVVLALLAFWAVVYFNVLFTARGDLLTVFISNYGLVTWALAGGFTRVALSAIDRRLQWDESRLVRRVTSALPAVMLLLVLSSLRGYARAPYRIESYQFAATNLTILMIVVLIAAARWAGFQKRSAPVIVQAAVLLALGTSLAYLVARMNSASIVLVWTVFLILFAAFMARQLKLGNRALLVGLTIIGIAWFRTTGTFAAFIESTRFAQGGGISTLSSVSTRSQLAETFWDQFGVDPVFGNYSAEVVAGLQKGEYVHSLPLSLLTHVGVIGFFLFVLVALGALRQQRAAIRLAREAQGERFALHLFFALLIIASWTTFFTWLPLWFVLGYMGVTARALVDRGVGRPRAAQPTGVPGP